jgi:hypothetical protein
MRKRFSLQGTYRWDDGLQSLVNRYNNNVHSSTGFKPSAVTKADEYKIMSRLFPTSIPSIVSKPRYKAGHFVRVSKQKAVFGRP